MRPVIGIVGQYMLWDNDNVFNRRYYFLDNYSKVIYQSGGNPTAVLPVNLQVDKDNLSIYDGFVICGGTNISKYHLDIIDYAYNNNIPIIGTCCGFQAIAKYLGYELSPVENHNNTSHKILIDKKSNLYKILNKEEIIVNSYHNYQIKGIKSTAKSLDNVVEAFEIIDKNHWVMALEWHPELLDDNIAIFQEFIKKCGKIL